jgi:hypothetical protein
MNNQIIAARIVQLAEKRRAFRELPASEKLHRANEMPRPESKNGGRV